MMGARWYDPNIGRWISPDSTVPDPTHPQKLNRYSYANNNPLRYVDPTGADGCDSVNGCLAAGGDFIRGATYSFSNAMTVNAIDAAFKAGEAGQPDSEAYWAGRVAGDIVATAQGGTMILEGATLAVGGGAVCVVTAGGGCVIGVPAAAVGAGEAAYGAGVSATGLKNLNDDLNQFNSKNQRQPKLPDIKGRTSSGTDYVLNDHVQKNMVKRKWAVQDVESTLDNPVSTGKLADRTSQTNPGEFDPATIYFNSDKSYVVRNDLNGNIIQISDRTNPDWRIPPYTPNP